MRFLLVSFALFGLAAFFGVAEPTPAAGHQVMSDDVRMVSEQKVRDYGPAAGKNAHSRMNGHKAIRGPRD